MTTVRGAGNRGRNQSWCIGLTRREFLQLAAVATGGIALSSCSPSTSPTPESGDQDVQLVYQDWRTDWFPPMVQQMLEQFHADHPNIHVYFTPDPENLEERMLSDFEAGIAPDVFQGCCTHFPIWAQEGYTLDLRPYVVADLEQATIDDWDPAQYRWFFTPDGMQFGLPKYHGALALYYNKDIFDRYSIGYPHADWDHDDYLEAMLQITRAANPGPGRTLWGSMLDVSWDRIQMHVNGWGGHFVDPNDPGHCMLDEPEALDAMEWIRARIWDDHVMASPVDVGNLTTREAFAMGRIAMVEDGSWALKDILAGANFRIGVAPFPAGPVKKVTLATTDGFGIYAGTKHPEAAWELLKFLIGKDYGRAMARANFLQPARASLLDDWINAVREEFPDQTEDVDLAAFADGHLMGYSVTAEVFSNMVAAKRLVYDAWEKIFVVGQAPVDLMKEVSDQVNSAQ